VRVEISPELYEHEDIAFQLTSVFRLFAWGRHDWAILPGHVELAVAYVEQHDRAVLPITAELARKASVRNAWDSTDAAVGRVTVTKETLDDDLADLQRPAYLVVENEISDGAFLRAVCHVFEGDDIIEALDQGRAELTNGGGGGQVPAYAAQRAGRFRRTVRVALVLDSDRFYADEETKSHELAAKAAEYGVRAHVLSLREIENYVPDRVLESLEPRHKYSAQLDALKQLSSEQRGCLDMKKGFGFGVGKTAKAPHTKHKGLYDDLPSQVRDALRAGFGPDLVLKLEALAKANALTVHDFGDEESETTKELRALLGMLREII
jgi:hypothetical protein